MGAGRFAPSPTGPLHLGNLRTALLAWLFARSTGRRFVVRMEDLDRVTSSRQHEADQLRDLAAIGLDWDGPVVRQSDRFDLHHAAIDRLVAAGVTYPCYCTRREIAGAAAAPHGAVARYPGTCAALTEEEAAEREANGRRPALRLRAGGARHVVDDVVVGRIEGVADDIVIRRNDGIPAYHLAVVVDDAAQGVDQVVRADDLAPSTPSQVHLAAVLDVPVPVYAHVPLAVGTDGARLAKRHGAVTMADLGWDGARTLGVLADSLGLGAVGETITAERLLERFDPGLLPGEPWVVSTPDSE